MGDDLFPSVGLLLRFDPPPFSGQSPFQDFSNGARTVTDTGAISGSGGQCLFEGGYYDALLSPWADDFSIEFIDLNADTWTGLATLVTTNFNAPEDYLELVSTDVGALQVRVNGVAVITGTTAMGPLCQVGLFKTAGNLRLFVNGVQEGVTYADANNYNSDQIRFGADAAGANPYLGTTGHMRYTFAGRQSAAYTPPTSFPTYYRLASGTVTGADTLPRGWTVRAYDRSSGQLVGETSSSSGSGSYSMELKTAEQVTFLAINADAEPGNDVCLRVDPTI
jgi:hypothetical protein